MEKIFFGAALLCLLSISAVNAKPITYQEEMYALGAVSGQGLACKSPKYHQFELLARAIVIGKAPNAAVQEDGLRQYANGKASAFMEMEETRFAGCAEILQRFENQPIFKSVLYSDGKLKLPDGTLIKPRQPYDASKLYVKDREAFIKMDAMYKNSVAETQKTMQNARKVPLKDARYESYSKQFSK